MSPRMQFILLPLLALALGASAAILLLGTPGPGLSDEPPPEEWRLPEVPGALSDEDANQRLARAAPWGADTDSLDEEDDEEARLRREQEEEARRLREQARQQSTWRLVGVSGEGPARKAIFVSEAGDWQRLEPDEALPGEWALTDIGHDQATLRREDGEERTLFLYQPERLQAEEILDDLNLDGLEPEEEES